MKRILSMQICVLLTLCVCNAKVVPAGIIGDNMVLQQQTDVALWGTAAPGAELSIRAGWTSSVTETVAGKDGRWSVKVHTPAAGGPYNMIFDDGEVTEVKNILIGEVWFCSGQSNMGMQMCGYDNQPVEGSTDDIVKAKPSVPIRMCTVPRVTSLTEVEDCRAEWLEHTPSAVSGCSAAAYYFASLLNEVLDVPVGLVMSYFGGSPVSAWMDRETLETRFPDIDISFLDGDTVPEVPSKVPVMLFNGMVAPIVPFTVKGILWYQGCEDVEKHNRMYKEMQVSYVEMMRRLWSDPDMPFYFVQLAPYYYKDENGLDAAYIREAQMLASQEIKHAGMVTTMDLGHRTCIHPPKKKEVGERLAWLALANDYGIKGFDPAPPVYRKVEFRDGKSYVYFKVGGKGVGPRNEVLGGFEVAGPDKVFHPATAMTVKRDCIVITCPEVKEPAAVRYCFRNWAEATLFSTAGVPASPFRTDNW